MKKLGLLLIVLVLVSCAPQPTPDLKATETAIAQNVLATLTAQVPTPTLTPEATNTPEPTNTPKPTSTSVATNTPTVTSTPTPDLAMANYKEQITVFRHVVFEFNRLGLAGCYAARADLQGIMPPPGAIEHHECVIEALWFTCKAVELFVEGSIYQEHGRFREANTRYDESIETAAQADKAHAKCERLYARLPD